jgi:hypothetical protein
MAFAADTQLNVVALVISIIDLTITAIMLGQNMFRQRASRRMQTVVEEKSNECFMDDEL